MERFEVGDRRAVDRFEQVGLLDFLRFADRAGLDVVHHQAAHADLRGVAYRHRTEQDAGGVDARAFRARGCIGGFAPATTSVLP